MDEEQFQAENGGSESKKENKIDGYKYSVDPILGMGRGRARLNKSRLTEKRPGAVIADDMGSTLAVPLKNEKPLVKEEFKIKNNFYAIMRESISKREYPNIN